MKITIADDIPISEAYQLYNDYRHYIIDIDCGKNYPRVFYKKVGVNETLEKEEKKDNCS